VDSMAATCSLRRGVPRRDNREDRRGIYVGLPAGLDGFLVQSFLDLFADDTGEKYFSVDHADLL
jgi:hypothetical protein